jgi:Phosphotransferase enzyme family
MRVARGPIGSSVPGFAAVFEPLMMETYVRQARRTQGAIDDLHCRVLKHHPGSRCTFQVTWRAPDGERGSLIGKVYADDRSDVYRVMEGIRRAGFGPEDRFSIPEPLAYLSELRLLLQEEVHGPRAKEILLTGTDDDRAKACERCAQWLTRFQAVAPMPGRVYLLADHLDSLEQWSQSLTDCGRPLADKAIRLSRELRAAARGIAPIEMCTGHGHYGPGHVVPGPARTVTIDWDTHDLADPCRDAARFLVELKRLGRKYFGSIRALDPAGDVFLSTYLSQCRPEVRGNLPVYRAVLCLHLAKKDIKHRADHWSEHASATLDEGLRVLERGS